MISRCDAHTGPSLPGLAATRQTERSNHAPKRARNHSRSPMIEMAKSKDELLHNAF